MNIKREILNFIRLVLRQKCLVAFSCFSLSAVCLHGCAGPPIRNPVPEALTTIAGPQQFEEIRAFITPSDSQHIDFFANSLTPLLSQYSNSEDSLTMLALSGGSDGGAYGAGFLNGWTKAGNRPVFDVVTGISTGALMAPFAFLGSESDEDLKAVYTSISARNIYEVRGVGEMLALRDAIADSKPLAQLLNTYVNDRTVEKIGHEHRKGRRLFVGTTDLDSGRLVVWDMGAIALSGYPDAPKLFRDVLLASASIPIAFPPVYISVEAEGKKYDEMHVDGGLMNQVFGVETLAHFLKERRQNEKRIKARVYMVRNSEITTAWQSVPRRVVNIANRTVDIMINSQSIGDIFRNYTVAQSAGIEFYLTGIPSDFDEESPEAFDTGYMNALYNLGYEKGKGRNQWEGAPQGLRDTMTEN